MENQVWQIGEDLIGRLRLDVAKYQESGSIFQKLETSGQLGKIYAVFFDLMKDEFAFTMGELIKLNNEAANVGQEFDIMGRYQQNSLIFKSNLQLICASVLDYVWMLFYNHAKSVLTEKGKDQRNIQNQSEQGVQLEKGAEVARESAEPIATKENAQSLSDQNEKSIPNDDLKQTQEKESLATDDLRNLTALRQRKQSSNEVLLDERTNHTAHEQIEVHQKKEVINEQIQREQDISIQNEKEQSQGISNAAESQLKEEEDIDLVNLDIDSQKQRENCEHIVQTQGKTEIVQKNDEIIEITSSNNNDNKNQQKIEQQEGAINVTNMQSGIADIQSSSLRTSYEQQIYRNAILSAGKTQEMYKLTRSQQSFQSPQKKEVSRQIENSNSQGRLQHHHKPSNSEVVYLSPDRLQLKPGMSVDNLRRNMETISMNWPNLGVTKVQASQSNQGDNSVHNITAQSGAFSENKSSQYQKGAAILNSPIDTSVASLARLLSGSKGFK